MKSLYRKRIYRASAILAACGLMLGGVSYPGSMVFATADNGTSGQEAGDTASGGEDDQVADGSQIMVKGLGNVTFYRWEKVKYGLFRDYNEYERYMFFDHNGKDRTSQSYIAGRVPDDLFFDLKGPRYYSGSVGLGSLRNEIPTGLSDHSVTGENLAKYRGSEWKYGLINILLNYPRDSKSVLDEYQDLVMIPDRAYNYKNKDPMIKTDRDVFFTDDDRNVPYVKGDEVFFAEDLNSKRYYLCLDHRQTGVPAEDMYRGNPAYDELNTLNYEWQIAEMPRNASALIIRTEEQSAISERLGGIHLRYDSEDEGVFLESDNPNNKWDHESFVAMTKGAVHGAYLRETWYKWNVSYTTYKGKEMHFSTLEGETTVSEDQVFNVSAGDYLDAHGNKKSTMGVMIPNGSTLIIDGGVVSVKGDLINNGTIEIKNGGVLLVQDKACVSSFLPGKDIGKNGCGSIKCTDGDIVIEKGGAIYAGMNDSGCNEVPFYLDNNSTLINGGLLVFGNIRLGEGTRVELRDGSKCYGGIFGIRDVAAGTLSFPIYFEDMDYDILSNYTSTIMNSPGGIPGECGGLNKIDNSNADPITNDRYKNIHGGFSKINEDLTNYTVLKYPKAGFDCVETGVTITDYKGL